MVKSRYYFSPVKKNKNFPISNKKEPFMSYLKVFISRGSVALFLSTAVFSQSNASPSEKYHSTSNTITKRAALLEIGSPASSSTTDQARPPVAKPTLTKEDVALLQEALSDTDPTVVEQAVRRIGELQVVQLNSDILDLYTKSDEKFSGYSERVKLAVIDAVGDIGIISNDKFLDSKIIQQIRVPYMHNVLQATKKLHAVSTIPSLQKLISDYSLKCQKLENANENPLIISSLRLTMKEAEDVLSSLTTAK